MPDVTNHDLDKRIALLEQTVLRLSHDLGEINKSINKLVWLIGSAIALAAVKFILAGGLHVVS